MALEHIDPYPWFLNKSLDLVVHEQLVHTRISSSEWADSWRPLLARLYDLWMARYPKRYLIAIAGPPGAGKSMFAEQLHFIIEKGGLHREAHAVALPMDGFHYPNAVLQAHVRKLPDGTEIHLSSLKGHPDTYDVPRLRRFIQALIERPEYLMWPGYSRDVHDVIPEKYRVHESVNLAIIEGNFLLLDRGHFQGLPSLFHLRIYVDAPAPRIIANLMDRHIRGGRSIDSAKEWVKRIDLPNARTVESTKSTADVIIERDTDDDIAAITWRGEAPLPSSRPEIPDVPAPAPAISGMRHGGVHAAGGPLQATGSQVPTAPPAGPASHE